MDQKTVNKILSETEQGYDTIAHKFSETRRHFWRGLEFIKDYTHEGDNILDFGCGNGRLLELISDTKGMKYLGVDVSEQLIKLAKAKYETETVTFQKIHPVKSAEGGAPVAQFNIVNPSQSTITLENDFFNTIYSIAVFHHFPSREYRQTVANEFFAKTKKDGTIVVTVWYLWQKKYLKNILRNWLGKLKGKSVFDWNDCEISFTNNEGKKIQRFHHAFTKGEFQKLFESAGFETKKCEVVDGRNILYIGKKSKC